MTTRKTEDAARLGFARFRAALFADACLSLVAGEPADWETRVLCEGDATLTVSLSEGLLTTRFTGPVTRSFLSMGQAWGEDAQHCATATAVVVDFAAAVVLFTAEDLLAVMSMSRVFQANRPRALLIDNKHAGLFREYALRSACNGVPQRSFLAEARAEAEAWAREAVGRCSDR